MTTTTNHSSGSTGQANAATIKQLRYLRVLANRTGTTFRTPATITEASAEIKRLLALTGNGTSFAELDVKHRSAAKLEHTVRDTAHVLDREISGYGSSATWSQRS